MHDRIEIILSGFANRQQSTIEHLGNDGITSIYDLKSEFLEKYSQRLMIRASLSEAGDLFFSFIWICGQIHDVDSALTLLQMNRKGFIPGFYSASFPIQNANLFGLCCTESFPSTCSNEDIEILLSSKITFGQLALGCSKPPSGVE